MLILGINSYHGDAAACLIRDGIILTAVEEERFRRIKHWAGFPSQAIHCCLNEAKVALSDIDVVAVNSDPTANFVRKVSFALRQRPNIRSVIDRVRNQVKRQSIEDELSAAFPGVPFKGSIHRVEHHLAHLASAFLVSPFPEACVASIDGFGDFTSTTWGTGRDDVITIEGRVYFPHSLGVFYQALTQYLGFDQYGDEYKVMGLAPYGEPRYLKEMHKIVKLKERGYFELDTRYFRHHREKIDYTWDGGCPRVGILFSRVLEELLGPSRQKNDALEQKHRDLARSVQAMYEEAFFNLITYLQETHRSENLALAGGCGMNSVANGKVYRQTNFKRVYVQAAAGDAGGAIGAAIYVWQQAEASKRSKKVINQAETGLEKKTISRYVMDHAYLGPSADDGAIESLLTRRKPALQAAGCHVAYIGGDEILCQSIAGMIAKGHVVGWFQGRMEWGPRALGNRSIIGDPRRANMKDILNLKIKRRESFRPFAPSILIEHVAEWFEEDGEVPFMAQVFQIKEAKRSMIPAVTHLDGSGRLQTVSRRTNFRYWNLIDTFRKLTAVPMVLNTSFNENEPVVCSPSEALDCFLRTKMDALVLGNWVVNRTETCESK